MAEALEPDLATFSRRCFPPAISGRHVLLRAGGARPSQVDDIVMHQYAYTTPTL
jgi:hypothetical protein